MEELPKNLRGEIKENIDKEKEPIDVENLEERIHGISKRFKKIIDDLKLNENSLGGSFADVYNNFRGLIITYPGIEKFETLKKRIETDPQLYQMKIESVENYLNLIEKYPDFLKLEISNKDPDNWGGLHDLYEEAGEERTEIKDSGDSSFNKRERVDIYIKKCSDWLIEHGDIKI